MNSGKRGLLGRKGPAACVLGTAAGSIASAALLFMAAILIERGIISQEQGRGVAILSAVIGGILAGCISGTKNKNFSLGAALISGVMFSAACLLLSAMRSDYADGEYYGAVAVAAFAAGSCAGGLLFRRKPGMRKMRS